MAKNRVLGTAAQRVADRAPAEPSYLTVSKCVRQEGTSRVSHTRLTQRWAPLLAWAPASAGWCYRKGGGLSVREAGSVLSVGVPYSEHSSFEELRGCVKALRPRRVVPTVNATGAWGAVTVP